MSKTYTQLAVKAETKELFKRCYAEFLKYNGSKYKNLYISEDFMVRRICCCYLDIDPDLPFPGENIAKPDIIGHEKSRK